MNKTIIALTLAAAIPFAAYAATNGDGSHHRGDRLERMAQTLNLDDAQKARMKALLAEHRAERKALREQMRSQIGEILNDDQRAKFDEVRAQRRAKHKSKRGRHQHKKCAGDEGASQKTS